MSNPPKGTPKGKKDEDDVKAMLLRIKRDCLEDYPYTDSDPIIDSRYIFALGLIASVVTEALQSVQQDRPFCLNPTQT
jgi:hypothetical protein